MTVYLDLLLLSNFCGDLSAWCAVSRLLRVRSSAVRLTAVSALGAIYASFAFFWPPCGVLYLPIHAAVLFLLQLILFGKAKGKLLLRRFAVTGTVFFLFGGAYAALCALFGSGKMVTVNGAAYLELPLGVFFAVYAGTAVLLYALPRTLRYFSRVGRYGRITVKFGGDTYSGTAMLDTGHSLRDGITGKSVVICKKGVLQAVCFQPARLRYLPVGTVTETAGLLRAVRCDLLTLESDNRLFHVPDALLAETDAALGGYDFIYSEALLERGVQNDNNITDAEKDLVGACGHGG